MSEETTNDTGGEVPKKGNTDIPQFLKVLFILSYIGIGLSLLTNIFAIGTLVGIINVIAALGCLYGVLQMKKLKKMGFYIYAVCEIVPVIYLFATMGATMFSMGNIGAAAGFIGMIMTIFGILSAVFPILFIVLYGLNLKHLK